MVILINANIPNLVLVDVMENPVMESNSMVGGHREL